jgi:hypothetical protein
LEKSSTFDDATFGTYGHVVVGDLADGHEAHHGEDDDGQEGGEPHRDAFRDPEDRHHKDDVTALHFLKGR